MAVLTAKTSLDIHGADGTYDHFMAGGLCALLESVDQSGCVSILVGAAV